MNNPIRHSLRKTALFLLGLLVILFVYLSYIQIVASEKLAAHPLNRRTAELDRRVKRGTIFDTSGTKLAYSQQQADGTWQREYPLGDITSHITGYNSVRFGLTGLEESYNTYLSGLANPERRLGAVAQLWPLQTGAALKITVDSDLQIAAWKALGSRRGAVIAIDPASGAILAMVSRPSFDPIDIDRQWHNISTAVESPLLNRATQGLYPPGSIIKILVAESALNEKSINNSTIFRCEGSLKIGPDYILHEANNQIHGEIDLEQALVVSCNATFGQLSLNIGRNKLANAYNKYGFTLTPNPDLGDQPSHLPDFSRLSDGDLAQTGIGQGRLLMTPLKMAMLATAFANQGTMMKPYIVEKITAPNGTIIKEFTPSAWLTPISPAMAAEIATIMITVVNEGTGSSAALPGIKVAGKTGTAENPHGPSHAWFIGFAPADKPKVAIAVIVENGGSGGAVAAPIARQVFEQALR